ncbi:MAG: NAD(P)H-dependent glycerol-3-phosphate dehydrogenase [Firmicutes bacterium]|nr:NAD(P)H-dependent glycerol-3-phosphate dehydrogenase [Bacillota bacterium]
MKVAVIGAGGWGTALATVLSAKGYQVDLWVRNVELYKTIILKRINETYLPDIKLPALIRPTLALEEALWGKSLIILAVPSHGIRQIARKIAALLPRQAPIVNVAKGLEDGTYQRLSQVLQEELPEGHHRRLAVLSGPNHAEEVSRGLPSATVVASAAIDTARQVQERMMAPNLRVYTSTDLVGVELGGALKNIIALGAGILDGLEMGDNIKAALVTRGLVEITRLGVALGARPATFSGLSGVGDLFATCASRHSRNRRVGYKLGQGIPLEKIKERMPTVAEGIITTRAAYQLSRQVKVEMPITEKIYQALYQGKAPREAVQELMLREAKKEMEDIGPGNF